MFRLGHMPISNSYIIVITGGTFMTKQNAKSALTHLSYAAKGIKKMRLRLMQVSVITNTKDEAIDAEITKANMLLTQYTNQVKSIAELIASHYPDAVVPEDE